MINATFVHASRSDARKAADAGGWDLDDLLFSVGDDKKWGWTLVDDFHFNCKLTAPPQFRRADAPPLAAEVAAAGAEAEPATEDLPLAEVEPTPLPDPEPAPEVDASVPPMDDESEADAGLASDADEVQADPAAAASEPEEAPSGQDGPMAAAQSLTPQETPTAAPVASEERDQVGGQDEAPKAQPGDLFLQVGGPMLSAAARLRAAYLAKQLGMTIITRDAVTLAVVEEFTAAKRGQHRDATDILIELCSQPGGASGPTIAKTLKDAGCAAPKGGLQNAVKACEKHGYTMEMTATVNDTGKPVVVYHLHKADEDAADLQQAAE